MPSKKTPVGILNEIVPINTELVDDLQLVDEGSLLSAEEGLDNLLPIETATLETGVVLPVPHSIEDIANLIVDIDEELEWLTFLAYGKNGTGKTRFGASGGKGTLIIDTDKGTLSAKTMAGVKKISLRNFNDFELIYWLLRGGKVIPDKGIEIMLGGIPYVVDTLVIDTVTMLQNICLRAVVLKEQESDASKDAIAPTKRDYGIMTQRLSFWLFNIKALPLHKIWLCQERVSSDDDAFGYTGFPALSSALRVFVCGQADVIGRTYLKQITDAQAQFRIMFAPNETFITKDRTYKLGAAIASPTFPAIRDLVFDTVPF